MKLTMSAKSLAAGLKTVDPGRRNQIRAPILSGVRLEASEDGLAIEATDLELTARRTVNDVVTQTEGVAVVPAKTLTKAVASMTEPEIELESTPNNGRAKLDVRAGTRTLTLQGWAAEDWPAIPLLSEIAPVASLDAAPAADALARAAMCASDDQARPVVFTYTTSDGSGPAIPEPVDRVDPAPRTSNQSTRIYSVRDPRGAETTFALLLLHELREQPEPVEAPDQDQPDRGPDGLRLQHKPAD
jgi:hypothetical protein